LRRLRPLADQLAIEAAQLRVSRDDVGKLLNQSLDALETSVTRNRKQKGDTQTPASRSIAEKTS
jgi:hypothetical protein